MTKKELVASVADRLGMSQKAVNKVLDETLAVIGDELSKKEEVILKDFGRFYIKEMKERPGRNPISGEAIVIPARDVAAFKPASKILLYSTKL